jgi:universal stress protein A
MLDPSLSRILVAVDFSEASRAALRYAVFLASRVGAALHVVHVWQTPATVLPNARISPSSGIPEGIGLHAERLARGQLEEMLAPYRGRDDVRITSSVEFGHPSPVVQQISAEGSYDLLVVGTHGGGGLARLFRGSVEDSLVRSATCPVLIVQAGGPLAATEQAVMGPPMTQ